jgi:hypothetical protein
MTMLSTPLIWFGLMGLGIHSVWDLIAGGKRVEPRSRNFILLIVALVVLLGTVYSYDTGVEMTAYLAAGIALMSLILYACTLHSDKNRKIIIQVCVAVFFIGDLGCLAYYVKGDPLRHYAIPRNILQKDTTSSLVMMDQQNPLTLPVRGHFNVYLTERNLEQPLNANGLRYIDFYRYYKDFNVYFPRLKSYTDLSSDKAAQKYLEKNPRVLEFLSAQPLAEIPKEGAVEKKAAALQAKRSEISWTLPDRPTSTSSLFKVYEFPLPEGFPDSLCSIPITQDRELFQAYLGTTPLKTTEGPFVEPFQFDVNNIRKGRFFISLPSNYESAGAQVKLAFQDQLLPGLGSVWKNEQDNFGFNYTASGQGWLMFRYPFTHDWKVLVDGIEAPIVQAHKYFFSFPVSKGEHKILLQYMPGSWLRMAVLVSIFFTFITFWYVCYSCICTEMKRRGEFS